MTALKGLLKMLKEGLNGDTFSSVDEIDGFAAGLGAEPEYADLAGDGELKEQHIVIPGKALGTGQPAVTVTWFTRDPVVLVRRIIRKYAGKEHPDWQWEPRPLSKLKDGTSTAFEHPQQCTWWHRLTALLRRVKSADAVVLGVSFYSDKSHLSAVGRAKGHPLMLTVNNSTFELRCGLLQEMIVALFPSPPPKPHGVCDDVWHAAMVQLHNDCVASATQALRDASHKGIWCEDADGQRWLVFPGLHTVLGDLQERDASTATRSCSSATAKPCACCECPQAELHVQATPTPTSLPSCAQVGETRAFRTHAAVAAVHLRCAELAESSVGAAKALLTAESLFACASGYAGWFGEAQDAKLDSMRAMAPDTLHNHDLGIWLHLLDGLVRYIIDNVPGHARIIQELNRRLLDIGKESPMEEWCSPVAGGHYVDRHTRITGSEHRNVMQIMPFALEKLWDGSADFVELFTLWNKYVMLVCRRNTAPGYTDFDLADIAAAGAKWLACAQRLLPAPYQASDWNLPKVHDEMCHVVTALHERGGARWLGCNAGEQALKVLKRLYARTNKHIHGASFLNQMVKQFNSWVVVDQVAQIEGMVPELGDDMARRTAGKRNRTAYAKAAETGEHAMSAETVALNVETLQSTPTEPTPDQVTIETEYVAANDGLRKLRAALTRRDTAEYLFGECGPPDVVYAAKSAALAGRLPHYPFESLRRAIQRVRASPEFYGRPRYDNVQVQGEDTFGGKCRWYAQVQLLFYAATDHGRAPFAFVRYYRELGVAGGVECPRVTWAPVAEQYRVLPLSAVLCKVQLVRDYGQKGITGGKESWYHNLFKWGHVESLRVRMDAHYAVADDDDDASPDVLAAE